MNKLEGRISKLTNEGNMTLVDMDVRGVSMTAIIIGKPGKVSYLQCGKAVELLFNESEVSVGKETKGRVSVANQLDCIVEDLLEGEIFTRVRLSFFGQTMGSLVTSRSAKMLELKKGDNVTAYIKINEVFLKEPNGIRNDEN